MKLFYHIRVNFGLWYYIALILRFYDLLHLPEHGGHRVVPHIVRHPDPSPEQLDGEVLVSASVKEDSVLRRRGEDDGDVGVRLHRKGLHLDVGRVVREAHAREVFATLSC